MKRSFRDLVLWIAVIGSFTISVVQPSLRLPAMLFVFIGITVMILRWRRRNPDEGGHGPKANPPTGGREP